MSRELRAYGGCLLGLAALLVVDLAVGPLGADVVDFGLSETLWNQLVGLEVVTLVLVVPWTLAVGALALRGHPGAPLLGFGPTAYTGYMYVQYVLGPEYDAYQPALLLQLVLASAGILLTLWGWSLARGLPVPVRTPAGQRRLGWTLLALAAFVLLRYVSGLVGSVSSEPVPEEFAAEPTFYWSIWLLDLGLVVPLTVAAGVATLRGTPAGARAPYAVMGWFALVPPSVAAMAAVMVARDDPNASVPTLLLLSAASVVFGVVALVVLRPLLRRNGSRRAPAPADRSDRHAART